MQAQAQVNNGDGLTGKALLIESDDRFLRSDGFWMALQRLYGGPLLDFGAAAMNHLQRTAQQPYPMPGTPADRCDLGLGYAAAGHILQIPPVVNRGAEIAGHFVNWETIERALDFALDGGLDSQWTYGTQPDQLKCPSTYGPAANIIIYGALNFVISAFLPTLSSIPLLESRHSFADSQLLRMIVLLVTTPASASSNSGITLARIVLSPNLESLSLLQSIKVLLILPFHLLRYILESPRLGNVEGWASTNLRQKVMHNVIEERERRRVKVLF